MSDGYPEIRRENIFGSFKAQYWDNGRVTYSCRLCSTSTTDDSCMALHLVDHALAQIGMCAEPDLEEFARPYIVEVRLPSALMPDE